MLIRKYEETDCLQLMELFIDTVHSINVKGYSEEEIEAWAPTNYIKLNYSRWKDSLKENYTFVATLNNKIVGFIDLSSTGYLDRLFVHKDYQNQGIASALLNQVLTLAKTLNLATITTEASIIARPFFEKYGFKILKKQKVERNSIYLINYLMVKKI